MSKSFREKIAINGLDTEQHVMCFMKEGFNAMGKKDRS